MFEVAVLTGTFAAKVITPPAAPISVTIHFPRNRTGGSCLRVSEIAECTIAWPTRNRRRPVPRGTWAQLTARLSWQREAGHAPFCLGEGDEHEPADPVVILAVPH